MRKKRLIGNKKVFVYFGRTNFSPLLVISNYRTYQVLLPVPYPCSNVASFIYKQSYSLVVTEGVHIVKFSFDRYISRISVRVMALQLPQCKNFFLHQTQLPSRIEPVGSFNRDRRKVYIKTVYIYRVRIRKR